MQHLSILFAIIFTLCSTAHAGSTEKQSALTDTEITISAEEVRLHYPTRHTYFIGNVRGYANDFQLTADMAELYYLPDGQILLKATGNISIITHGYQITCAEATISKKQMDLNGNVQIQDKGNCITGEHATYIFADKTFKMTGHSLKKQVNISIRELNDISLL